MEVRGGIWVFLLLSQKACDGIPDCPDGEDENNCQLQQQEEFALGVRKSSTGTFSYPFKECNGAFQFLCGDGSCLDLSQVCDGRPDCSQEEDERNCPAGGEANFEISYS